MKKEKDDGLRDQWEEACRMAHLGGEKGEHKWIPELWAKEDDELIEEMDCP